MARTPEQKAAHAEKMQHWRRDKKATQPQEQGFIAVNKDPKPNYQVSDRLDEKMQRIYEQVARGCEKSMPLVEIERRILALNTVRKWYPESTVRSLVRIGFEFFTVGEQTGLSDDELFDNCE
jgi:hypothetical protein